VPAATLTYHDVVPRAERSSSGFVWAGADRYKLTPEQFEAHLDAIGDADVLLTFDDGGVSALTYAAPALERRGRRGVFFVTTSYVGGDAFLDADGIRELAARGHEVGSHSHTHPALSRLPRAQVDEEWRRSRDVLGEILGAPVRSASTPGGFLSRAVWESAAAAGYERLYTSEPWLRPRGPVHGRFSIVESTTPEKVAALCRGDRRAVLLDRASWEARKVAKRTLGPVYSRVRDRAVER
jgi:peptidoglycan/xylan/chitin deacetylase (PgdA/CDA1 family)